MIAHCSFSLHRQIFLGFYNVLGKIRQTYGDLFPESKIKEKM